MTPFNPEAATAAWLARIPPADGIRAEALTSLSHWNWAVGTLITILACWIIARSGVLSRLKTAIEAEGPRPWLAAAACSGGFVVLLLLLRTPWALFMAWRVDQLRTPPVGLPGLVRLMTGNVTLQVVAAAAVLPLAYAIARRAPRLWWAWIGGAGAIAAFALVWAPYALASGPAAIPGAPAGPVRDGLVRLVRVSGLGAVQIQVSDNPKVDADVTGVPGRPRIVISRGMIETASRAEALAAVGHLIGHFRHADQLSFAVVLALLAFAGAAAVGLLFRPVAGAFGLKGERSPADPASLPVSAAILAAWVLVATPVFNGFDRWANVRADQYSLDQAQAPDGLAATILREHGGDKADPSPLEEAIFYDPPAVRGRLLRAMRWKAAHSIEGTTGP